MEDLTRPLSRRELLRISAAGAGFATLGPFLAACGGDDSEPTASSGDGGRGGELKMWWWGEQEAVGIQSWVDATIGKFKTANGTAVTPTLMDTAQRRAAVHERGSGREAARRPVPVQRHLPHGERVAGLHRAAHGLVDQAVLDKSGATKMSVYRGQAVPRRLLLGRRSASPTTKRTSRSRRARPRRTAEGLGRRSSRRARSSSPAATSRSAAASRTASWASGTWSTG